MRMAWGENVELEGKLMPGGGGESLKETGKKIPESLFYEINIKECLEEETEICPWV